MVCFWRAIVLRKWVMFFLLFRAFSIYIGCANMMSRTCAVLRLVKTRKCSSSKTERQLQSFNVTFSSLFFRVEVFAFRNGCEHVAGYSSVELSE